jgi:hypothetical protein
VSLDAEGYGFPEHQKTLARLIEDIRILSPAGVERAAQGWDRHARLHGLDEIHKVRRNVFGLTESGTSLVSWKAEHGEIGHKAEDAAFMAALGLVAGNLIGQEQQETLLRPLSEALPWLLPEENQPVA